MKIGELEVEGIPIYIEIDFYLSREEESKAWTRMLPYRCDFETVKQYFKEIIDKTQPIPVATLKVYCKERDYEHSR